MVSEQFSFTEIILEADHCTIYILTHDIHIAHLSFSADRHHLAVDRIATTDRNLLSRKTLSTSDPIRQELTEYLAGKRDHFSQPTSPFFLRRGTPWQQRAWSLIAAIPYGETTTYGELANRLGNPALARAVGQAANANPLALLIPCHRVVGKGSLGGYAGGIKIKQRLLEMEQNNRKKCRERNR